MKAEAKNYSFIGCDAVQFGRNTNVIEGHSAYSMVKEYIYLSWKFPRTWSLTLREERMLRVFENRVQRRIFGPNRDEVTGEWRKLHSEELDDLYCSHNTVRVIKSSTVRWAGHVARMGEGRRGFRWGNMREKDHLGDAGIDGRIILRWIFRKWDVGVWTGSIWLRIGTGGGRL